MKMTKQYSLLENKSQALMARDRFPMQMNGCFVLTNEIFI